MSGLTIVDQVVKGIVQTLDRGKVSFFPKPSRKRIAMTFVPTRRANYILPPVLQFREYSIFHVAAKVIDTPPGHTDFRCRTGDILRGNQENVTRTYIMQALKYQ